MIMESGQQSNEDYTEYLKAKRLRAERPKIRLLLKEARDMLVLCTLLDKSGQCSEMVEKIESYFKKHKL
jgi:hypothetical protein